MDVVEIEKAYIVGTSLGAPKALEVAPRHTEKVMSLSANSRWTKTDLFIDLSIY